MKTYWESGSTPGLHEFLTLALDEYDLRDIIYNAQNLFLGTGAKRKALSTSPSFVTIM
jgi:hypothetical protein